MNKEEFIEKVNNSAFPVLNDSVYEYILTLIIEHTYEPGQKINMSQIAEDLQVSRTPVRAALERLEAEGLVCLTAQKGYEIRKIEWNDCLALYKTRELIEGYAASEAAFKRTADGLAELEQIIENSKEHAKAHNLIAFLQDDIDFHRTIVKLSGNRHLLEAYDHLITWMRLYQHLMRSYQSDTYLCKMAIDKHSVITRSIKLHLGMEAKNQSERHVQDIYYDLASLMAQKH